MTLTMWRGTRNLVQLEWEGLSKHHLREWFDGSDSCSSDEKWPGSYAGVQQAHLASPDRTAIDEVTSDVDPSSADLLCSPRCSTLALHRAMGHRILLCLLESFTAPVCGKVPMLSLMSDMFLPSQSFF